jgi:hypothetical protein
MIGNIIIVMENSFKFSLTCELCKNTEFITKAVLFLYHFIDTVHVLTSSRPLNSADSLQERIGDDGTPPTRRGLPPSKAAVTNQKQSSVDAYNGRSDPTWETAEDDYYYD